MAGESIRFAHYQYPAAVTVRPANAETMVILLSIIIGVFLGIVLGIISTIINFKL